MLREKIHLCREYAQEAELLARAAHPERRVQYKKIAAQWLQISAELEQFGKVHSEFPTAIGDRPYQ